MTLILFFSRAQFERPENNTYLEKFSFNSKLRVEISEPSKKLLAVMGNRNNIFEKNQLIFINKVLLPKNNGLQ